jgi:dihydrodipicolinate synthase/N-acetylneuraminate lyase
MAETACKHMADHGSVGKGAVLVGSSGMWDRDFAKKPDPEVFIRQGIELSQYAESVGAAGVVHTMPEALDPKAGETYADVILRYFETIQACVKVPVLIYQPPGTDERYRADAALIGRLADLPNIKGMKVSTSDAEYIFNLTYAVAGKDFGFICGCETAFLAALVTGARAVIGQGAAVNPQVLKAVQDCYDKGDLAGAIEAQHISNVLVEKSKNTIEFFKQYATEKGYPVKPFARAGAHLYGTVASSLSQEDYEKYKGILEAALAKYPV